MQVAVEFFFPEGRAVIFSPRLPEPTFKIIDGLCLTKQTGKQMDATRSMISLIKRYRWGLHSQLETDVLNHDVQTEVGNNLTRQLPSLPMGWTY